MDIEIQASKHTSVCGIIENNELDIESSYEELLNELYFFTIYKLDNNSKKELGTVEITYMDVSMAIQNGYSTYDLFDLIDSEKQAVCSYLFDKYDTPNNNYVGYNMDVVYIDKIFIKKEYRNQGIGSEIVSKLPELIRNMFKLKPGCLVLLANPFEMKKDDLVATKDTNKIEKLISFYENQGFKRIEGTQYLVRKINNPEYDED